MAWSSLEDLMFLLLNEHDFVEKFSEVENWLWNIVFFQNHLQAGPQNRTSRVAHLSDEEIDRIPVRNYRKSNSDDENCPICVSAFENQAQVKILECKHIFHAACIDPWLKVINLFCVKEIFDFVSFPLSRNHENVRFVVTNMVLDDLNPEITLSTVAFSNDSSKQLTLKN